MSRWALIALTVSVFLLGVCGFELQQTSASLSENLYRSLQLFAAEFPSESALENKDPNPLLSIARFAAPIILVATVADLFSNFVTFGVRRVWQLFKSDRRVILLGFGSIGHALTYGFAKEDRYVTVIDGHFDEKDRLLADELGLLLIEGDLSDRNVYELGRIWSARDVYVACGSDEINIEIGALAGSVIRRHFSRLDGPGTIQSGKPAPNVHVHLSSTRLAADLGDATDLGFERSKSFSTFSLKTAAARDLLASVRLTQRAMDFGQRRIHLVLCGVGDYGEALLIETLLTGFGHGLNPPKISVLDQDKMVAEARFRAIYTRLFDDTLPHEAKPIIDFYQVDLRSLDMERSDVLCTLDAEPDPPTAYVFSCGEDLVNLSAALRLETAMRRLHRHPVPIFSRQWDQIVGPGDVQADDPLSLLRTFGNARTTASRYMSDHDVHLRLAQKLHGTYTSKLRDLEAREYHPNLSVLREEWAQLPHHAQRSNLRAVRQGAVQLISLGLQWRAMNDGGLPRISSEMAEQIGNAINAFPERTGETMRASEAIETSARAEHARWMVDKAIEGMRQSPNAINDPHDAVRDNQRGWHTQMISFDQLRDETKGLDLALIRTLVQDCGEAVKDRPLAYWRKVGRLIADQETSNDPFPEHSTEIELTISGSNNVLTSHRWKGIRDEVLKWSKQPHACRLHLRISAEDPYVSGPENGQPVALRPQLSALLRSVESERITVDVTRTPRIQPYKSNSSKS